MTTPPATPAARSLLDVSGVAIAFGGLKAVDGFELQLNTGDLHGLIGPNGAGKTTVFNLITGIYKPTAGDIRLAGRRLNGLKPERIAHAGIARTFQNIRLFAQMSVLDNVRVACHLRARHGVAAILLRSARHLGEERAITQQAQQLLELMGLTDHQTTQARNLSYGDQRRLEIARALATSPKVLLLDEPAAGLNTTEKHTLARLIRDIRTRLGLTILLIDHDMGLIMDICERITVLDYGKIIAVGTPVEVQNNPRVIEAYLGEESGAISH